MSGNRPPPPSSHPPRLDDDLLDRPRIVPPPRLKSPSRQRDISKSNLPVSTRPSPPTESFRSSSVDESPRGRTSRPSQILLRDKSSIPQRGAVVRNSLSSVGVQDILRQSETGSKIPRHTSRLSESPPKTVFKYSKPSNTRHPSQTSEPVSKSDENLLATVKLRRNANEYLKVNKIVSKSTTVRGTTRPPSEEISQSQKERPDVITSNLSGPSEVSSEPKSPDSLDSQPKTFIVSTADLPPTTSVSESKHPDSLISENEIDQHLQTETTTMHTENKHNKHIPHIPFKPRYDPELTIPTENNNNMQLTSSQDIQHTSGNNNHRTPETSFINNGNVNQSLSMENVELVQKMLPEYENLKLFNPFKTNESETDTEKVNNSAPSDEAENSSPESELDNLIKSAVISYGEAPNYLLSKRELTIDIVTTLIHSESDGKDDILNISEKKKINKGDEKFSNSKLEPIYESLGKTAFNLKTPSSRSPNIPGSGPSLPQPVIQATHSKYGGSSAASGRESRAVRKYWDEDSLCSPLTREQRAAANPGLSLPAPSSVSDTQATNNPYFRAEKSFSLGDYYNSEPATKKSKFNLKTSGLKFLHRLNSLRQSFKSKQEISVFPLPESSDSDRVFFRGFSGRNKDDYESAYKRPESQLISQSQFRQPTAPPRKKRPNTKLTRSLSLTDAEFITQAVAGGQAAKIEEIYPDFPRSTPIYAVIDRSKKTGRDRCKKSGESETADRVLKPERQLELEDTKSEQFGTKSGQNVAEQVSQSSGNNSFTEEKEYHSQTDTTVGKGSSSTLNTEGETSNMVKSYSASNSPITNTEFDANDQKSKHKKKKHKKKKDVDNESFFEVDKISNTNFHLPSNDNHIQDLTGPYVTPPLHVTTPASGHVISYRPTLATPATTREHNRASDPLNNTQTVETLHKREKRPDKPDQPDNTPDTPDTHTEQNLNLDPNLLTNNSESRGTSQAAVQAEPYESQSGVIGVSSRSLETECGRQFVVGNDQFDKRGVGESNTSGNVEECDEEEVRDRLLVAKDNIRQAESILSSLLGERRENLGQTDSDACGLAPDIETNIRSLEKTREDIGDVIDIFRSLLRRQKQNKDRETKRKSSESSSNSAAKHFEVVVEVQHKVSFHRDLDNNDKNTNQTAPEVIKNLPQETFTATGNPETADTYFTAADRSGYRSTDRQRDRSANNLQDRPADRNLHKTAKEHLDKRNTKERKSREHRDGNSRTSALLPGDEANKPNTGRSAKYQRKHSGTRILQTCQKYLSRQSSESSVSPQRGPPKKTTWYDGDVETSDPNSGQNKPEPDSEPGDIPGYSTRAKLHDIARSFGKGKKKPRKAQPKKTKDIFDVVSDIQRNQATSNELLIMGNNISSAEEAHAADEVVDDQLFITTPGEEDEGAQSTNKQSSSPTYYHTAESSSTSSESPKKRVHLLIETFEQKMDVGDGQEPVHSSNHLTPNTSDKSSRTSVISSQSGSSESFDDDQQESKASSSTSHNDDLSAAQRQEKKVYYVAREIMSSEKVFVDVLRLLNIEFREYVERKMQESKSEILPEEDFGRMFSNLPELLIFNEDLLKDFEDRVENWDTLKKIADVIVRKGPFLKLYTIYIRDFSLMCVHFDECFNKYPNFNKIVKDFESLPRCQNLKLKHYMLKPVQRLPQYRLLLEDYLKHLGPDSIDFDDTTQALRIVSEAAKHANNTVEKGDRFQRLLHLQSRLGDFELIKPGRELIKEGELQKISRKEVVPRYFILLTDCLLYTTYHGPWVDDSTSLRVSYMIMLNQLRITVPQSEAFQTEFSMTSNVRSVTVRASSVNDRNDWLEAINSAIEENQSKKASFLTVDQLNPLIRMEGELGDTAPVWIPDQRVTMCQACSEEFTLVNRRHHCRACGKVVCSQCSANKAPLKYRQFESVRVCGSCFDSLKLRYRLDTSLLPRFKKRDVSRTVGRYIPQRLKLSANAEESQMSGYLKQRMKGSRWKSKWFVLKDRVLYTYRASEDTVAVDTVPVLGWQLETLSDKNFELYEGVSAGLVFQLAHPGREAMVFCAENDNFAEKWMTALREATTLEESSA